MERIRKKKIKSRGVLLFAFNSSKYNYAQMAVYTARRIETFLGIPTTLVTDVESVKTISTDINVFDSIIEVEPDLSNIKEQTSWINKGRYQAYELSPYQETLLIDVDYLVNSETLLKTFDLSDTFCCHSNTHMLMHPEAAQEKMGYSYETLWATVIMFKKSERAKQIFDSHWYTR